MLVCSWCANLKIHVSKYWRDCVVLEFEIFKHISLFSSKFTSIFVFLWRYEYFPKSSFDPWSLCLIVRNVSYVRPPWTLYFREKLYYYIFPKFTSIYRFVLSLMNDKLICYCCVLFPFFKLKWTKKKKGTCWNLESTLEPWPVGFGFQKIRNLYSRVGSRFQAEPIRNLEPLTPKN